MPAAEGRESAVAVIGGGSWGTALAVVLARGGARVALLVRDPEQARAINREGRNPRHLPQIPLPPSIRATVSADEALGAARLIVYALPCAALPAALDTIAALGGDAPVIAACKGLHHPSGLRVDEMVRQAVGVERTLLLSGPSFAGEVATGAPTAITLAAAELARAEQTARWFAPTTFRIYPHDDLIGVALGGALKNVIAIAAGIADGLGLGHNAMAALITRGMQEINRLAVAYGARPRTLYGLSGLGDLVLTCTGEASRNRRLGRALAGGATPQEARAAIGEVTEGAESARTALALAERKGCDAPIIATVCRILDGVWSCRQGLDALLARPERAEFS
ncbi:MAG: NAD(P)-dependent glycerol-3-phosphate dehydrogenase [Zetaproteobacteria bacterium]|nr:MAG: NAD(P)-dependent glycerol-3-phosphate dehydrogenase [Zetaproteobacteria bacterium]